MKLIKDSYGLYRYVTEDRKIKVTYEYPSLSANRMFWCVKGEGIKGNKYFKSLDEVKKYVNNL